MAPPIFKVVWKHYPDNVPCKGIINIWSSNKPIWYYIALPKSEVYTQQSTVFNLLHGIQSPFISYQQYCFSSDGNLNI